MLWLQVLKIFYQIFKGFVALETGQMLENNMRNQFLQRFESAQLAIDFPLMKAFCMLKDVFNFLVDGSVAAARRLAIGLN